MKGLYIYLLFSTACAYKLEYDFFKLNKKVNNIDRLFFKRFWWITRKYRKCTETSRRTKHRKFAELRSDTGENNS